MNEEALSPIRWEGDAVIIVDQRALPNKHKEIICRTVRQVLSAIRNMAIRGAPAIGIAGAMALALGSLSIQADDPETFRRKFTRLCNRVRQARPTGHNLEWAVERMYSLVVENPEAPPGEMRKRLREESIRLMEDDVRTNRAIGTHGKPVIPEGARILTYCNAGALATGGYGTALGVIRAAFADDPRLHVYACETRPFLQGARLTAYELVTEKIPCTLITDNAAGRLMQEKEIDVVVVGADRIAANGDTANKIGTYTLAVLAHVHGIPFYVAAPRSTIDPRIPNGTAIPIEERNAHEVTHCHGRLAAPRGMKARYPAFDVTPARFISGIITEVGILRRPYKRNIRKALEI